MSIFDSEYLRDDLALHVFVAVISRDGLDEIADYVKFGKLQMDRCYDVADGMIASMTEHVKAEA